MAGFDRYSSRSEDGFLAEGGRVSPVRFDPAGFEDCARDWDPCVCHGDRLCRLGQKARWMATAREHAAWLRGEREDTGERLLRVAGCAAQWELDLKIKSTERSVAVFWSEMWPLIATCASEERSRLYAMAVPDDLESRALSGEYDGRDGSLEISPAEEEAMIEGNLLGFHICGDLRLGSARRFHICGAIAQVPEEQDALRRALATSR